MTQHTPGPLKNVKHSIYSDAGYSIALTLLTRSSLGEEHDEANARRLVASWNACDGISTDELETTGGAAVGWTRTASKLIHATTQRDELLEALKHIEGVALADEWRDLPEIAKHARAAIAKAEGGAV